MRYRFAVVPAFALVLGCNRAVEPAPQPSTAAPVAPATIVVPAAPDPAPPVGYVFSPLGKRDPFRAVELEGPNPCDPGRFGVFHATDYRLVGTVTDTSSSIAMVSDPEQVGLVVRRGSHFGCEKAEVTRIEARRVEAIVYRTAGSRRVKEQVVLAMAAEPETRARDLTPEGAR